MRERVKTEAEKSIKYLKIGMRESHKFRKRKIFSVLEPALGYIPVLMSIRKNPDIVFEKNISLNFYDKTLNRLTFYITKY